MNILLVTHKFLPDVGGIQIVANETARRFAEAGHKVTIVASRLQKSALEIDVPYPKVRVIRVPAVNPTERVGVPFPIFSPSLGRVLAHQMESADVVHVHGMLFQSSAKATRIAARLRKPIVLTEHVGFIPYSNPILRGIERAAIAAWARRTLSRAHVVTAVSQHVQTWLQTQGLPADRLRFIPNGIDCARFTPADALAKAALRAKWNLPPTGPLVLFVGRFIERKGIRTVIDAAAPDFTTLLAGSGDLDLPQKPAGPIVRLPSVPHDQMHEIYQASDLFVLPSYGEGFPLSVQEAMACGLPVVARRDDLYDRMGLDAELFRQVDADPTQVRSAVRSILSDEPLRRAMSDYSAKFVRERFDWSACVAAYLDIYEDARRLAASPR